MPEELRVQRRVGDGVRKHGSCMTNIRSQSCPDASARQTLHSIPRECSTVVRGQTQEAMAMALHIRMGVSRFVSVLSTKRVDHSRLRDGGATDHDNEGKDEKERQWQTGIGKSNPKGKDDRMEQYYEPDLVLFWRLVIHALHFLVF